MQKFSEVAASLNIYRGLARRIFPDGAEIQCLTCEIVRTCSVDEIAEWTHYGFPVCRKCGRKTDLVNIYAKQKEA